MVPHADPCEKSGNDVSLARELLLEWQLPSKKVSKKRAHVEDGCYQTREDDRKAAARPEVESHAEVRKSRQGRSRGIFLSLARAASALSEDAE